MDDVREEETREHNSNRIQIRDPPFRILIIGDSGSGKTNSLFTLIIQQPDKIYYMLKIHMKQNINY